MTQSHTTLDGILANHNAKVAAQARGDLPSAHRYAETSASYALLIDLGQHRISREEFIRLRNQRLRDRAERLRREGHEPHNVAGILARENVFDLAARTIRRVLRLPD
jgi:hypothetical protein